MIKDSLSEFTTFALHRHCPDSVFGCARGQSLSLCESKAFKATFGESFVEFNAVSSEIRFYCWKLTLKNRLLFKVRN